MNYALFVLRGTEELVNTVSTHLKMYDLNIFTLSKQIYVKQVYVFLTYHFHLLCGLHFRNEVNIYLTGLSSFTNIRQIHCEEHFAETNIFKTPYDVSFKLKFLFLFISCIRYLINYFSLYVYTREISTENK